MRTFDPAPLWRSTIGFDRLFDHLNASTKWKPEDNYPPYLHGHRRGRADQGRQVAEE